MEEKLQEVLHAVLLVDNNLKVAFNEINGYQLKVFVINAAHAAFAIILMLTFFVMLGNMYKILYKLAYTRRPGIRSRPFSSPSDSERKEWMDKTEKKIKSVEFKTDALRYELQSARDEILRTISAMPPAMGESYASAASRFEFRQEEEEELRNRKKTGKDK